MIIIVTERHSAGSNPYNKPRIAPEDAFLCRDLNGNGKIDDASELFSSTTDPTTRTGFEALARLDDNEDGVIDAKDDVYETLLVWRDMNIDGQTQPAELSSISAYNIAALPLVCSFFLRQNWPVPR